MRHILLLWHPMGDEWKKKGKVFYPFLFILLPTISPGRQALLEVRCEQIIKGNYEIVKGTKVVGTQVIKIIINFDKLHEMVR